jgi:predicted  nucleic acid-binding Zn-ribbon protein
MIDYTWKCQECGRKFRTVKAAENAAMDGCPKCGGVDIDIDTDDKPQAVKDEEE